MFHGDVTTYLEFLYSHMHRTRLEWVAAALADGRTYTVRIWEERRDDEGDELVVEMYALVVLAKADNAEIGEAVAYSAITDHRTPVTELPGGKRYQKQRSGPASALHWIKIA